MEKVINQRLAVSLGKMREILQEDFMTVSVLAYEIREELADGLCRVRCELKEVAASMDDNFVTIEGSGVGLVDAFFDGLANRYRGEHPSLGSIRFSSFAVRGLMSEADKHAATDAQASVVVGVTNSYGEEFEFQAVSQSVIRATIEAVLDAVGFFIASERAYVRLLKSLRYHQAQDRADQVTHYTRLLTEMVRNTSYSSVIEQLETE